MGRYGAGFAPPRPVKKPMYHPAPPTLTVTHLTRSNGYLTRPFFFFFFFSSSYIYFSTSFFLCSAPNPFLPPRYLCFAHTDQKPSHHGRAYSSSLFTFVNSDGCSALFFIFSPAQRDLSLSLSLRV
jgi:hypothetical protein